MSDDHKLPVKKPNQTAPVARETYVQSPVQGRSIVGRAVSRFMAVLNKKTIDANTDQVRALNDYVTEKGRLADATLDADRKIANYVNHRDDIIAIDHERHVDAMEEERTQRELNRLRRAEMLRAAAADHANATVRHDYDSQILQQTKEAELTEAQWQRSRAKWGLEAFTQSMPYRKERLRFLATSGALDHEIEMLVREEARDKQVRQSAPPMADPEPGTPASETVRSTLHETIAEVAHEIELARARHASEDEINALVVFLARLSTKRSQSTEG